MYKMFKDLTLQVGIATGILGITAISLREIEKGEKRRIQQFEETNPGVEWKRALMAPKPPLVRFSIFNYEIVAKNKNEVPLSPVLEQKNNRK